MTRTQRRKPNPGTDAAQLAVMGAMGIGSAMALGRGYLAERRSRALDRELLRALALWRLAPETRLSPPVAGVHVSPRLRELVPGGIPTPEWDDRKRELIAQARSGDIRIGTDHRGAPFLSLPGHVPVEIEFSRLGRKRNDARGARSVQSAPWAFAQYDDVRTGSWGVLIDAGAATLYRYDGASWRPVGPARWNESRGRLEGASVPTAVLSGIARAVLETPAARDALRAYLATVIPQSFTGTAADRAGRPVPTLTDAGLRAVHQVGRARCAAETAERARRGTKVREKADEKAAHDLGVARLALAEVCGRGGDPIDEGSPCDVALDTLRRIGPDAPCALDAPSCPRQVTSQEVSAWRAGAFPPIGPYETTKPHAMGADPCCYYHPATQARLALRQLVEGNLHDEVGSEAWLRAVREAEASSPFASVWAACDRTMERRVDPLAAVTGEGVGSSGAFLLLKAFYEAAQRNDVNALTDLYGRLRGLLGELPPLETLMELDANFWDLAIQEARDSGNLGYQRWVQTHGGKAGRTVFKRYSRGQGGLR